MEQRLLSVLEAEPNLAHPLYVLLDKAGVSTKKLKEAKRTLKALIRKGVVEKEPGRRYRLSRAGRIVEGQVDIDRNGTAWLIPNTEGGGRAVMILPEQADRLDAGVRVKMELVVRGRQGRHYGRLLEVLEEDRPRYIGVFRRAGGASFVELDAPSKKQGGTPASLRRPLRDVLIDPDETGTAKDGQLVQVELLPRPKGRPSAPIGRVVDVLGAPGHRNTELRRILMEHDLDVPFPPQVESEAAAFGDAPRPEDLANRRDIRDLSLVTIDGETAKDFDDAVFAERVGEQFRLIVAIADVGHYVTPRSELDKEARRRGTSTYLTDRAIPMLPEALSNGLCSLKPKVDRLCMFAELTIDDTGHVVSAQFDAGIMRSNARLTYTQVAQALEGEPDETCRPLMPTLLVLAKVAQKLLGRRLKRGAIDLDLPEPTIVHGPSGDPVDAISRPRNDAHRLIEDLMLITNEAVAHWFVRQDIPSIFRIHENPDPERLSVFASLCAQFGLRAQLSENPRPDEVAHLLNVIDEHPFGKTLHGLLLRSLAQARYDTECKGHYGLASPHYLHFTSPIRRYPDLIVHRLMKARLAQSSPPHEPGVLQAIAAQSSNAERKAMSAERASMDLDRALLAKERIGEPLVATITGVQGFGLFAAADQPFLEGMIPVQSLPPDYYELDPYGAALIGQNLGSNFMLGDRIRVEIAAVQLARRRVEFRYLGRSSDTPPRPEPPRMAPKPPVKDRSRPRPPKRRRHSRKRAR